jgi:2-polyprenyl-3-methyl-5-hydroxy-6-metoxy-1,4-benzoquinol methylase
MSLSNPKQFWTAIAKDPNWRDYILPRQDAEDLDREGALEAERLYYFFDRHSTIVDYGCGIGRVARHVAPRAKAVIGLDISHAFITHATCATPLDNVTFHVSDDYQAQAIAEFVYCLMVFQHNDAAHRTRMLHQIHALLKPGGTALIQFPRVESDYYHETDFVHTFSRDEVRAYGARFPSFRILEGNLVNYEKAYNRAIPHEYFLIATR